MTGIPYHHEFVNAPTFKSKLDKFLCNQGFFLHMIIEIDFYKTLSCFDQLHIIMLPLYVSYILCIRCFNLYATLLTKI